MNSIYFLWDVSISCYGSVRYLQALIAVIIFFPSLPGKKQSYGNQIKVATKKIFIISVLRVIFLNRDIYAAYSYIFRISKFIN